MKKKLALIIISADECFTKEGFSGGGHKVTKHLIMGLISSDLFEIDIFCKRSEISSFEGINSIKVLNEKTFIKDLENELSLKKYDYILSSDVLLPFGNLILHSNSAKYKSKNGKSKLLSKLALIYNSKKIKPQENVFKQNDKHIFAVSNSVKEDYSSNYNIDKERIFVSYPSCDKIDELYPLECKSCFTIGAMAGGGLNKGGYLLLLALKKFVTEENVAPDKFRARIIFPKMHKAFFYNFLIKALNLGQFIELLPKQSDMNAFYRSIDCYVLPSLNEAFGLVVPEAASNGRPSIVSSTTGGSELVINNENGFIFDREKNPVKNLAQTLKKVFELYFTDYNKFQEISKNAYEMSKNLDWQQFTDTIIKNMKEENV